MYTFFVYELSRDEVGAEKFFIVFVLLSVYNMKPVRFYVETEWIK